MTTISRQVEVETHAKQLLTANEIVAIRPGATYRQIEKLGYAGKINQEGARKTRRFSLTDYDAWQAGRNEAPPRTIQIKGNEYIRIDLVPMDRETAKAWSVKCPALANKPLKIESHHYRPGNEKCVAHYIWIEDQRSILSKRSEAKLAARTGSAVDERRLTYEEAHRRFRFSYMFLNRYSRLWHPKDGKPHPLLGRWIQCGTRPSLSERTAKDVAWFWTEDLQELHEKIKKRRSATAKTETSNRAMTLVDIAATGIPLGTASSWPRKCVYLSDRNGKLTPIPNRRIDPQGKVTNGFEFDREVAELAIERYKQAKFGSWKDTDGSLWLLQRRAIVRGKLNRAHGTALPRLVEARIVERKRAPMWAFGSKHGETPWVYRVSDLDDVARGDRSAKVLPNGSRVKPTFVMRPRATPHRPLLKDSKPKSVCAMKKLLAEHDNRPSGIKSSTWCLDRDRANSGLWGTTKKAIHSAQTTRRRHPEWF